MMLEPSSLTAHEASVTRYGVDDFIALLGSLLNAL